MAKNLFDYEVEIRDILLRLLLRLLGLLWSLLHELSAARLHESHSPVLNLFVVHGQIEDFEYDIEMFSLEKDKFF